MLEYLELLAEKNQNWMSFVAAESTKNSQKRDWDEVKKKNPRIEKKCF